MNKERVRGFISGVLITILVLGMSFTAFAATGNQTITAAYNNIKIYIDEKLITPKDANGKTVEPFIYNGTTYLPVRAVGEAFGKNVDWDSASKSVIIGKRPAELTAQNTPSGNLNINVALLAWLGKPAGDFTAMMGNMKYVTTYTGGSWFSNSSNGWIFAFDTYEKYVVSSNISTAVACSPDDAFNFFKSPMLVSDFASAISKVSGVSDVMTMYVPDSGEGDYYLVSFCYDKYYFEIHGAPTDTHITSNHGVYIYEV